MKKPDGAVVHPHGVGSPCCHRPIGVHRACGSRGPSGPSRRQFVKGVAGLAGAALASRPAAANDVRWPWAPNPRSSIYLSRNGTPDQNVAKVFQMAYGGIENFIGPDDIVLLRPNLQWPYNGYTNTAVGKAMIDLILNRPGGFSGEIIVIEDQHRSDPHTSVNSGWCTPLKASNGPYNWFELIQHYVTHKNEYPNGIHTDPTTGQINVTFQFLMESYSFTLPNPHPILSTYGGKTYSGTSERIDGSVNPFLRFKNVHAARSCYYARRTDLRYSSAIARVSPLRTEYEMSYPVFKSQHSGLYVSYFKDHPTAWNPVSESFTPHRVRLINMSTLNHHGVYAGVTSIVKAHFGMVYGTFHEAGWPENWPATFHYAGGTIGYWMETIRRCDLHMSCAERIGRESRWESDAFQAKTIAISTDPVALDYLVGKYVLFPAGGQYGAGGESASEPWSNDPSLPGSYYGLTLEFCRDPLRDHSIINGTLNEAEMAVRTYDFARPPTADFDGDGDVDGADFGTFAHCYNGTGAPVPPGCEGVDLSADGSVDGVDYGIFSSCFNGSGNPPRC